jgi:nucleoside-diphosphate-sugar epimerase
MNVLVTGGAGNLGRCLADELTSRDHRVTLFDRVSPQDSRVPWQTNLPFVQGELTSGEDCARAIQEAEAEAICHVGAITYATDHPQSVSRRAAQNLPAIPEDETFRTNVLGTYYILDQARRNGVKVVAAASSYFVLGLGFRISKEPWWPVYLPIDENHPNSPEDSYSLSKLLNEEMLKSYTRAWGIRTIAFRLMGVYYHFRDDSQTRFREKATLSPHGPPSFEAFQYVDGRDAAQGFRRAIEASNLDPFEAFFLASDRSIEESPRDAVLRLYPHLSDMVGSLGPDDLLISIDRARKRLGYEPKHSWRFSR